MIWDEESIKKSIFELTKKLNVKHFPTHTDMRNNQLSGLSRAIYQNGGTDFWLRETGLKKKVIDRKWNETNIESEILKSAKALNLYRMPTSSELRSLKRLDLQVAISKNGGFRYWSKKVNLPLQENETNKGQRYEDVIEKMLKSKGFEVERMTTGHAYDIVVDDHVKIDVKVASPHHHFGTRSHTFRPPNKNPSCDIYICVALNEDDDIENIFVIPSKFAKVQTLNITAGGNSKYNNFIDKWSYVSEYSNFFNSVSALEMS